ncbi:thioredoxin domain-containing protein 3 homolog isoform X2 [Plodia interpunctella]|uniref:thioredoxin domain-containing protein 3 homolog isoform X2 n=1 Tax=Plodia interpunctella TaxID=58824 RepID=UPI002367A944|nr:thioredoxin domain-containing protein 3 homolog isoform X2 [Plodia interpunctella]
MKLARKKAAQVQLQSELNTDDEWNKFVAKDGLLVIDVYSEWCGPCIGMVGNLKKIKVELGGDNLHLAVAKSDHIECLKRFRKRSEPTWMFLAGGQLLNVVFGADAPRLTRTIEQELKNEEQVKKGERERPKRLPHELTTPEQEVATAQEKLAQERRQREVEAVEANHLARREARAKRLEAYFNDICPALMTPHAQKNLRRVAEALDAQGVIVADKCPWVLGKDGAKRLALEDPEFGEEHVVAVLADRPALILLLKKAPEKEGCVIELTRLAMYGDGLPEEERSSKKFPAEELRLDNIPGIFVPADRHQRAAALDLLFPKMVGAVVEPPPTFEPPHIAMMFGAWQRRSVLEAAEAPHIKKRILRYGFFADANIEEPKLLAKNIEKYEERPEKDYCETIVVMIAVGVCEPALADPQDIPPPGAPAALAELGPLRVSPDAVSGEQECRRFFPPGYSEPEVKYRPKGKKKKKKRPKEDTVESQSEAPPAEASEAEANGEADSVAEDEDETIGEGEENGESDEAQAVDKATSPPPA